MEISTRQEQGQLTIDERLTAKKYLVDSRDKLVRCVTGLTGAQWSFKPSAERWSILEVLEHLWSFENAVHEITGIMKDLPRDSSDRNPLEVDKFILANVLDWSKTLRTPVQGEPTGGCKPEEVLELFTRARSRTLRLLEQSSYLRGRVVRNPLYTSSDWDGYAWIVAAALHTVRHTMQIEELKNEVGFPSCRC